MSLIVCWLYLLRVLCRMKRFTFKGEPSTHSFLFKVDQPPVRLPTPFTHTQKKLFLIKIVLTQKIQHKGTHVIELFFSFFSVCLTKSKCIHYIHLD